MDKDELIDSVGVHINHINTDEFFQKITRLSELGENWFIPSECPKCGRYIEFSILWLFEWFVLYLLTLYFDVSQLGTKILNLIIEFLNRIF